MCPVNVAIFYICGYVHTIIWFNEYPCVLTNSFEVLENIKFQTWDPVSKNLIQDLFKTFQNLIHLSAVPPPVAKIPCSCGDHPIAFTAAWWSKNLA